MCSGLRRWPEEAPIDSQRCHLALVLVLVLVLVYALALALALALQPHNPISSVIQLDACGSQLDFQIIEYLVNFIAVR